MRCLYRIAPDAHADLDDIWTYIAEDNIAAANRLLDRLHETFAMLSRQPLLGELREELGADYRSFHVGRYVIYYRPMRGYRLQATGYGRNTCGSGACVPKALRGTPSTAGFRWASKTRPHTHQVKEIGLAKKWEVPSGGVVVTQRLEPEEGTSRWRSSHGWRRCCKDC